MDGRDAQDLLSRLRRQQDEMTALLVRLALAESPTTDPAASGTALDLLARELGSAGLVTRRIRSRTFGDHLYARPTRRRRRQAYQLVLGHYDTVWPVGSCERMPVRVVDDELYGPGVFDMKGGLVQLVFALRALGETDIPVTPVVLLNSDEEVGSLESSLLIGRLARGAVRAFVLEPGEGASGRLKTARKGVGRFEVRVLGKAAHAGASFDEGASAILELSHQVQQLFALNDPARGVTVNVGTIDGGVRPNVVAPEARAHVDVRVPTARAAAELTRAIEGLRPVLAGTEVKVSGGIGRPPMEASPGNRRLFRTARRLAASVGLEVEEHGRAGGGSDANTTARFTPTLDGLGAVGRGAHAVDEHVFVSKLPERAALLALLLAEPAEQVRRALPLRCRSTAVVS